MSHPTRPAAKSVAELIVGALDPLLRKRGLARAELIAWWPDIVGETYARWTAPERIRWPRDGTAATLVIRCDPSLALQLAHEVDRVRERLNFYLGYPAVAKIRIIQQRFEARENTQPVPAVGGALPAEIDLRLRRVDEPLRDSLRALGHRVFARS